MKFDLEAAILRSGSEPQQHSKHKGLAVPQDFQLGSGFGTWSARTRTASYWCVLLLTS